MKISEFFLRAFLIAGNVVALGAKVYGALSFDVDGNYVIDFSSSQAGSALILLALLIIQVVLWIFHE